MRPEPEDWRRRGLCREIDPDLWSLERGQKGTQARRICNRCPVRIACRNDFLDWAPDRQRGTVAGGWMVDSRGKEHPHPDDVELFALRRRSIYQQGAEK